MTRTLPAAVAAAVLLAVAAAPLPAQERSGEATQAVLVELFTSQG